VANHDFNFNADSYEPLSSFTLTPKGEWNMIFKSSELAKLDQNGNLTTDSTFVLNAEVIEGSAKGGEISIQLALWKPDDNTKNGGGWGAISRRRMRSITDALGIRGEFNTAMLLNRPFTAMTDLRFKDGKTYPDIKKFSPFVGQGRAAGADPQQPTPPAAGVGGGNAPTAPTLPGLGAMNLPQMGAPVQQPMAGFIAPVAPMAPPVATQQAPVQMPQGFQMPGQQTAPVAPVGMQMPQMGGFAPPAPPAGTPAFQAPPMGGPGPWAGGVPR